MEKQLRPQLRFPEFEDRWVSKKLGEIGKVSMCKRVLKDQTKTVGNIPFYKIGTFGKEADAFIDKNLYNEYKSKYSFPKKGEILISASGTIGRTVIYNGEPAYFQDSNIVWIANNEDIVLNSLLVYSYENVIWTTENTTIARLYNDNLRNIVINIPSLPEQQKIAAFLTDVDAKITQLTKKKSLLEQYKKGIMQKIFNQELRFEDDNGNKFPDWEEKKLGTLVKKAQSGGTPKSTNKSYYDGNIPFLSISDMTTQGKYLKYTSKSISQLGIDNSSSWIVPINSLIYSMYASVGFVSINKIDLASSQAVMNIILKDNINIEYIYYYLDDFKQYIHRMIETGTQGNINASIVKGIKIKLPCLEEQTKIANFLSDIDEKIEALNTKIENTQTFKNGLLQQMFV